MDILPGHHDGCPTGLRRLTPSLLQALSAAEHFTGLPPDVSRPGQVLAAFKAAAPCLGLPPRLVHAVDWLFKFTQPQDWEEGARPIVWPSAATQCLLSHRYPSPQSGARAHSGTQRRFKHCSALSQSSLPPHESPIPLPPPHPAAATSNTNSERKSRSI